MKYVVSTKKCILKEGLWTDRGYGLDRNYYTIKIHCKDCEKDLKTLFDHERYQRVKKHRPTTYKMLLETWRKYLG